MSSATSSVDALLPVRHSGQGNATPSRWFEGRPAAWGSASHQHPRASRPDSGPIPGLPEASNRWIPRLILLIFDAGKEDTAEAMRGVVAVSTARRRPTPRTGGAGLRTTGAVGPEKE